LARWVVYAVLGVLLTGCGTVSTARRMDSGPLTRGVAVATEEILDVDLPVVETPIEVQTWSAQARDSEDVVEEAYDPWEPFNERMFEVNRNLDRYVLKPVAKAYNFITPSPDHDLQRLRQHRLSSTLREQPAPGQVQGRRP
jgi:phospholipid-binding lipoprotein MlaA